MVGAMEFNQDILEMRERLKIQTHVKCWEKHIKTSLKTYPNLSLFDAPIQSI